MWTVFTLLWLLAVLPRARGDPWTETLLDSWAAKTPPNSLSVVAMVSGTEVAYASTSPVPSGLGPIETMLFEIGSTTKVFTAVAAQLLVDAGWMGSIQDPIADYLPATLKLSPDVAAITLRELASHTSGLARMPSNFKPANPLNPYADYSVQDLYAYLQSLTSLGPKQFLYSNLGFGLLGLIVSLVMGQSYEAAVKELVITPLGLFDTTMTLSPNQQQRLVPGTVHGKVVPNWTFTDALAGAGALRSTASDLGRFLQANLGVLQPVPSNISQALFQARQMIASDGSGALYGSVGEAFQQYWSRLTPVVWKDGATGGYNCYSAFDEERQLGLTWLSNVVASDGLVDQYAQISLGGPIPEYEPTTVSHDVLRRCLGQYEMTSTFGLSVTGANSTAIFVQGTNQQPFLFAAFGNGARPQAEFASPPSIFAELYFLDQLPSTSENLESLPAVFPLVALHQAGRDLFCERTNQTTSSQRSRVSYRVNEVPCHDNDLHYDLDTRAHCRV